jgi:hypothetical protein
MITALGPIQNGADTLLDQNPGTLPWVGDALLSYFQQMTFTQIVKTISPTFQVIETPTNVTFYGVWQPMGPQELRMKPEGQRAWRWFQLHADPTLVLTPDEVVTYHGDQFRVMKKLDYTNYGYNEYHLQQDYTGSGPNP